jgi:hypothetical protein
MKTADQILKEHEDANEMHFHQVDREWIIKAMEEYARAVQPWIRPKDQMPEAAKDVPISETDFRRYARDFESIDTGTPSGLGRYLEWLEELICDEEKLQKVKADIKKRKKPLTRIWV